MGQILGDILKIGSFIPGPQQPFVAAASGLDSTISGIAGQNAQNQAAGAAQQNESNAYAGGIDLSKQLAQGPDLQSLINAERGGVETLKSNMGGVANPGAMLQQLFGGNIENALSAALGNRSSNLQGAINGVLGAGRGYGNINATAGNNARAMGNPYAAIGSAFSALRPGGLSTGSPAQTGTQTGPGSSGSGGGGDFYNPSYQGPGFSPPPPPAQSNWDPSVGGGMSAGTDPVSGLPFGDPSQYG